MAFTFKKTLDNISIGNSLYDKPGSEKVNDIMEKAKKNNVKIVFPVDYVTGDKFGADAKVGSATDAEGIKDGLMGLDIGPKSQEIFKETILASKTILWNGPPGVFEFDAFAQGSKTALDACIEAASKGATVIVGGGDTATVVASECTVRRLESIRLKLCFPEYGAEDKLSHVSTGGGASLELLEGKVSEMYLCCMPG